MILAVGQKTYLVEKSKEGSAPLPNSNPSSYVAIRQHAELGPLAPWPLTGVQDDKPSAHGDLRRLECTA